jgi:hypothetical protein
MGLFEGGSVSPAPSPDLVSYVFISFFFLFIVFFLAMYRYEHAKLRVVF